jgi:hypothetical protein
MRSSIDSGEVSEANMIGRAKRFPFAAIMHYRVVGDGQWYVGTVENMSYTGVLFHGEHVLGANSSIEVSINVPGSLAAKHNSKMVSRGKVVRVSPDAVDPQCTMMAAELYHVRILRD